MNQAGMEERERVGKKWKTRRRDFRRTINLKNLKGGPDGGKEGERNRGTFNDYPTTVTTHDSDSRDGRGKRQRIQAEKEVEDRQGPGIMVQPPGKIGGRGRIMMI